MATLNCSQPLRLMNSKSICSTSVITPTEVLPPSITAMQTSFIQPSVTRFLRVRRRFSVPLPFLPELDLQRQRRRASCQEEAGVPSSSLEHRISNSGKGGIVYEATKSP